MRAIPENAAVVVSPPLFTWIQETHCFRSFTGVTAFVVQPNNQCFRPTQIVEANTQCTGTKTFIFELTNSYNKQARLPTFVV